MTATHVRLFICVANAALIAMASSARAETLILSANVPPTHWASTEGLEPYMACVTDSTGGEVKFDYYPTEQLATAIDEIELRTGLPATDPLTRPLAELVDMVLQAFPMLSPRRTTRSAA